MGTQSGHGSRWPEFTAWLDSEIEALEAMRERFASAKRPMKLTSAQQAQLSLLRTVRARVTALAVKAATGDDLLTALYQDNPRTNSEIADFFSRFPLETLREAADLCGVDAAGLTRGQCEHEIWENF